MIDSTYRLYYLTNLQHFAHLGWYFPRSPQKDEFSSALNPLFKNGDSSAFQQLENMIRFSWLGWLVNSAEPDVIVVARSSGESGKQISVNNQVAKFVQRLISKNILPNKAMFESLYKTKANQKLHTLGGKSNRRLELNGSYRFENPTNSNNPTIFLFDDISTTGSSIEEIHRAIVQSTPNARIFAVCLAQTISTRAPEMSYTYCIDETRWGYYLTFNDLWKFEPHPEKWQVNQNDYFRSHLHTRMAYYSLNPGTSGPCRHPSKDGEKYDWYIKLKGVKTEAEAEEKVEKALSYINA